VIPADTGGSATPPAQAAPAQVGDFGQFTQEVRDFTRRVSAGGFAYDPVAVEGYISAISDALAKLGAQQEKLRRILDQGLKLGTSPAAVVAAQHYRLTGDGDDRSAMAFLDSLSNALSEVLAALQQVAQTYEHNEHSAKGYVSRAGA
jgi:hypothetical protein